MRSNVTSTPSVSTRFNDYMNQIPLMTRYLIVFMVAIYLGGVLFGNNYQSICFLPAYVLYKFEIYRIFTSVAFHGGLLHILFNMMAFKPMGHQLELLIGSVAFLYLIFLFTLLAGLLMLFIATVAWKFFAYPDFFAQCAIGFSGVIFALLVVHLSTAETQSIFGFFSVPSKLYPWALLILFQVIMPGVSFLGHLTGILVGYLYIHGFINVLLLSPVTCFYHYCYFVCVAAALHTATRHNNDHNNQQRIRYLENLTLCFWLYLKPGFIANPAAGSPSLYQQVPRDEPSSSSPPSSSSSFYSWFSPSNSSNSSGNSGTNGGNFSGQGHTLGGDPRTPPSQLV